VLRSLCTDTGRQGFPGITGDSLRLPGITCSAEVCWSFLFLDIFGFAYTSAADEAFGGKKFFLDNRSCSLDVSGVTLTDHLPRGRRSRSYKQKYQNHESVVCWTVEPEGITQETACSRSAGLLVWWRVIDMPHMACNDSHSHSQSATTQPVTSDWISDNWEWVTDWLSQWPYTTLPIWQYTRSVGAVSHSLSLSHWPVTLTDSDSVSVVVTEKWEQDNLGEMLMIHKWGTWSLDAKQHQEKTSRWTALQSPACLDKYQENLTGREFLHCCGHN